MKKGFTAVEAIIGFVLIPLALFLVTGWVMNIVKLAHSEICLCAMPILRLVGIFMAPLGGILGYISG